MRRHRLAERLVVDVLGLGWAEAHDLAGAWQAVIDERTEPAIVELLDAPTTCPRGSPIPGMPGPVTLQPLNVVYNIICIRCT